MLFLRLNNYCRRTFGNGQTYQTVTVFRIFAFFTLLFNPNDVAGTCGSVCSDICNHKPCTDDFVSPDDSLCECFPDGTYQCAANSFCAEANDACTCNAGYEGDPLTGCVDINECRNDVCGPNGNCVNTPGSYECECIVGYTSLAPKGGCVDINECVSAPPCGPNSICSNTVGSFQCGCKTGYSGNPPSIFCADIDECTTRAPCGPNAASCSNIDGSYTCTCNKGYNDTSSSGGGCVNINECTEGGNNCITASEVCADTVGSFTCTCKTGYQGTAGACVDVDECATGTICGPDASCTNSIGTYKCDCNPGFLGGRPPECRKLNAFEKCPGPDSDCSSGLECSITSRSDSSKSCCPTPYPCGTTKCCRGAYTEGQTCPSKLDIDCRDGLACARRSIIDGTYICCGNTFPFFTSTICV